MYPPCMYVWMYVGVYISMCVYMYVCMYKYDVLFESPIFQQGPHIRIYTIYNGMKLVHGNQD